MVKAKRNAFFFGTAGSLLTHAKPSAWHLRKARQRKKFESQSDAPAWAELSMPAIEHEGETIRDQSG
eukprot:6286119-Karenia_brevis.AAC.1